MTFDESELVNHLFYNPFQNKGVIKLEHLLPELESVLEVNKENILPLQFGDNETKNYIVSPRVFRVNLGGDMVKIRYSETEDEAEKLFLRSNFAFSLGIPVSSPLARLGKFTLFEYLEGNLINPNFSENYIGQISEIQAIMNSQLFKSQENYIKSLLEEMVEKGLSYLSFKGVDLISLKKLERNLFDFGFIRAVFDHQDYGIHNLLVDSENHIKVIDEEAFGIVPLGYGVIRPIYGRDNYRVVRDKDPAKYLDQFGYSQRKYIEQNFSLLRSLFIFRNSVRRFLVGNDKGAFELLKEVNELK